MAAREKVDRMGGVGAWNERVRSDRLRRLEENQEFNSNAGGGGGETEVEQESERKDDENEEEAEEDEVCSGFIDFLLL